MKATTNFVLHLFISLIVIVGGGSAAHAAASRPDGDFDDQARDVEDQSKQLDEHGKELRAQSKELQAQGKELRTQERELDAQDQELEGQLAEARARLEQAAHEVAELSSEMGRPLMNRFIVSDEGPQRAVIGVQLDPESGKDGARIKEVSPGGPSDDAGLLVGDIITRVNGTDVKGEGTARQVVHLMRKIEPESKVSVRVLRNGKTRDFVVTARRGMTFLGMPAGRPLPPMPPMPPMPPHYPAGDEMFGPVFVHGPLGDMELASLTPQLGRYFGIDKGVLVVRAPRDFKLEDGDVILAIDGREPNSGSHATRILSSYQPGEKIAIKVMRQRKTLNVETALPERAPPGLPHDGPGRDGPGRDGPGPAGPGHEKPGPDGPGMEGPERDRRTHMMPHGVASPAT